MIRRTSFPRRAKRAIDITLSGLGLVVLMPILALAAACVLVLSGRPILFRQERVGQGGRPFTMLKFRTMVPDAEQRLAEYRALNQRDGPLFKLKDDPRVTPIGRLLRATSVDELPQLWNVLVGDMSLVGPRPALFAERAKFPPELLAREDVPQGITGLWQLKGRGDAAFNRYRQLDLEYIQTWTVRGDLWILARTPFALLSHALRERRRGSRETMASSTTVRPSLERTKRGTLPACGHGGEDVVELGRHVVVASSGSAARVLDEHDR